MNEFNFAALTNIVYCNQKLYNWQDYDHFHALLAHAHDAYDQLAHPFHAAAYPISAERFKARSSTPTTPLWPCCCWLPKSGESRSPSRPPLVSALARPAGWLRLR